MDIKRRYIRHVGLSNITVTASSVYRCLLRNNLNKKPIESKPPYQKFKEYEPGILHIDEPYLPKIQGQRKYLFMVIDRATRLLFYKIYDDKTADNASEFLSHCKSFFPFTITKLLTDNGKEFSLKLHKGRNNAKTDKVEKLDTNPRTPKTSGMRERVNLTIKANTLHQYTNST